MIDPIPAPADPYDNQPGLTAMRKGVGAFSAHPSMDALNSHLAGMAQTVNNPAPHPLASLQINAAANTPTTPMSYGSRIGQQGPKPNASDIPTSPTYAPTREAVAARFASSNPRSFVKREPNAPITPHPYTGAGLNSAGDDRTRAWGSRGGAGSASGFGRATAPGSTPTVNGIGQKDQAAYTQGALQESM